MNDLVASLRLALLTLLVCVGAYTAAILGFAQVVTPATANGSLLHRADGTVLGSRLIAQSFARDGYFWPRPSAVAYNAAGAGGSNKSPTNPELTERARQAVAAFGATADRPLPAELAAAAGSGLDPHITLAAAHYQVARVAQARGLVDAEVRELVERAAATSSQWLRRERVVNVLELNLALDR